MSETTRIREFRLIRWIGRDSIQQASSECLAIRSDTGLRGCCPEEMTTTPRPILFASTIHSEIHAQLEPPSPGDLHRSPRWSRPKSSSSVSKPVLRTTLEDRGTWTIRRSLCLFVLTTTVGPDVVPYLCRTDDVAAERVVALAVPVRMIA